MANKDTKLTFLAAIGAAAIGGAITYLAIKKTKKPDFDFELENLDDDFDDDFDETEEVEDTSDAPAEEAVKPSKRKYTFLHWRKKAEEAVEEAPAEEAAEELPAEETAEELPAEETPAEEAAEETPAEEKQEECPEA